MFETNGSLESSDFEISYAFSPDSLGEKCPNTEVFLIRVFLYLD